MNRWDMRRQPKLCPGSDPKNTTPVSLTAAPAEANRLNVQTMTRWGANYPMRDAAWPSHVSAGFQMRAARERNLQVILRLRVSLCCCSYTHFSYI